MGLDERDDHPLDAFERRVMRRLDALAVPLAAEGAWFKPQKPLWFCRITLIFVRLLAFLFVEAP